MKEDIYGTLPDKIKETVERFPQHGIGFINPVKDQTFFSFPELIRISSGILHAMQQRGFRPGDRVMISLEKGEEIIPVLWACLLGGIVPALLQPPVTFTEFNPAAEKTEIVFRILNQPFVIRSNNRPGSWSVSRVPMERQIDFRDLSGDPQQAVFYQGDPDDLAVIQFSSGSTGDPKGVRLTHRNILTNIADIIKGIRLDPGDISVNWMPLYHDMGLVGFHFTPTVVGVNQYFVDPVDFVKNPSLWLDALYRVRCTITACPNFGQAIVNRYLSRRSNPEWDFSSLRIIFNGAEPISIPTMNAFLEHLSHFGLNPVAMFPAYGLAEATLAVTFPETDKPAEVLSFLREPMLKEGIAKEPERDDRNTLELVNLGKPLDHCELKIVTGTGSIRQENRIGEVWISGDNVTAGYFGQDEHDHNLFSGKWMKTGDLGFMCRGDLFITGRSKDIIFVNGSNYYAHDLENIVIRMEEMKAGKIVITGSFDESAGRDQVLIFIVGSPNDEMKLLCGKIKNRFASLLGLTTDLFIPVRSADIPRTSSGKIQRYKLTDRYRKGEFEHIIRL